MDDSTPRHFHPPTPASTLLARLRKTQIDPSTGLKLGRLKTGVEDVDEYLFGGGVQRGCVVGVSSGITSPNRREAPGGRGYPSAGDAEGDTGRLLTIHILARSLLERPHSHASVIDSTGSFPLALFAGVVRWCVERGVGAGSGSGVGVSSDIGGKGWGNGGGGRGGLEEKVNAVLERVGVTRVFDIEGLWEVLGEVGGATRRTEGGDAHAASIKEDGGTAAEGRGLHDEKEGGGGDARSAGTREIMDSDADDDDDDDDLATHHPPTPVPQNPQKKPSLNTPTIHHTTPTPFAPVTPPTTEIILLDNLTTLITTLFSRTSTPLAHRLLSQLSLTLSTLARSSSVTIFLLNTLVRKSAKTAGNPEQQRKKEQQKQHSVFAGMTATPSLGVVFDGFVELHLVCFALPRGREDAEGVYGVELPDDEDGTGAEERGDNRQRGSAEGGIRFANVIEVLKDDCPQLERWEGVSGGKRPRKKGDRENRWASFGVVGGVGLVEEVFEVLGGRGDR